MWEEQTVVGSPRPRRAELTGVNAKAKVEGKCRSQRDNNPKKGQVVMAVKALEMDPTRVAWTATGVAGKGYFGG